MTQKELKARYAEILAAEVWPGSPRMVEYCTKKAAHIVELSTGDIIALDKPTMETRFCFGYSDSRYDTEDFDRAQDMAHHARTSQEYFLQENLRGLREIIERLEAAEPFPFDYHICIPYTGQPESSKLKRISAYYWHDERGQKWPKLTGEDRARVAEGYRVVMAAFEKRLHAYLKRYGLSKIDSWTYWRDA